jgi:hypothetical protein
MMMTRLVGRVPASLVSFRSCRILSISRHSPPPNRTSHDGFSFRQTTLITRHTLLNPIHASQQFSIPTILHKEFAVAALLYEEEIPTMMKITTKNGRTYEYDY